MRESSGMQKCPPVLRILNATVIPQEACTAASVVDISVIQRHVDGVGGGVVMRSEEVLAVGLQGVLDDEVHVGLVVAVVAGEYAGHHGGEVVFQHVQPVSFPTNLFHVDVDGGNVFVTSRDTVVLVVALAAAPLAEVFALLWFGHCDR